MKKNILPALLLTAVLLFGLFFNTWNINFGLPHSFYADEPEIAEPAIKYTYEIRDIIKNNNYYKLIPISYVYGTFPTYFLTVFTMGFSKFMNLANLHFDKTSIYIFMRLLTTAITLGTGIFTFLLAGKLFKEKNNNLPIKLISLFLILLNWKFIVHSHYVNADIFLTFLLLGSIYFLYKAYTNNFDNLNTVLSAILFGLAYGTKFTALISLPCFIYIFLAKKDLKALFGFIFTSLISFLITNPFSLIFFSDFSYRIFEMFFKEAGMVFDSVDTNPLKYIDAFIHIIGIILLPFFILGIYSAFKKDEENKNRHFHFFIIANILFYLLFYSLQSRRVERWLLPIIPLVVIYISYGLSAIKNILTNAAYILLLFFLTLSYLYYPSLLLFQFRRDTPKSEAYKWAKENIPTKNTLLPYILVYTEEGLDPMNKLNGTEVIQTNVYESENSFLQYPINPNLFEYVIISSRPMQNFKREEVIKKYPQYVERWNNFENTLTDKNKFEMIKEFSLPKPNLIPLSDVYVFKNMNNGTDCGCSD